MNFSRATKASVLAIVMAVTTAGAHAGVTHASYACGDRYWSSSQDWPYTGTKYLIVTSYAMAPFYNAQTATAYAAGFDWWIQATNMNFIVPAGVVSYTVGYHQVYDPFSYNIISTFGFSCSSAKSGQAVSSAVGQLPHNIVPGISIGSKNDPEFAELRANAQHSVVDASVEIARTAAAIRAAENELDAAPSPATQAPMQMTPAQIEASELRSARLVGSREAGVQTAQGWTGLTRLFRSPTKNEWFLLEELDVTASGARLVVFKESINSNVNGNVASLQTLHNDGAALTTLNFISGTKRIRIQTNAPAATAGDRLLAIARSLY